MHRVGVVVVALLVAGCGNTPPAQVVGGTTPLATAPLLPPAPAAESIEHDGSYKVGRDIAPGIWHTEGARRRVMFDQGMGEQVAVNPCHWSLGEIEYLHGSVVVKATAAGDELGPKDVDVHGDATFTTDSCRVWRRIR
jgi:hypothetical protein